MLYLVPCTLEDANAFVKQFHRHCKPVIGTRIVFAAADKEGMIQGVILVGRPVSRVLDDGWTLEINRLCTNGYPNTSSFLIGSAWIAAKSIGYKRLITYTLPEEGGASLKAVGWNPTLRKVAKTKQWNTPSRPRKENDLYSINKYRWEISIEQELPFTDVTFPMEIQSCQQIPLL